MQNHHIQRMHSEFQPVNQITIKLSKAPAQEYWLPGYELSRQIVLRQIQYFLGPSATVRPYSLQVLLIFLFQWLS